MHSTKEDESTCYRWWSSVSICGIHIAKTFHYLNFAAKITGMVLYGTTSINMHRLLRMIIRSGCMLCSTLSNFLRNWGSAYFFGIIILTIQLAMNESFCIQKANNCTNFQRVRNTITKLMVLLFILFRSHNLLINLFLIEIFSTSASYKFSYQYKMGFYGD